jgi:hypothetical protein
MGRRTAGVALVIGVVLAALTVPQLAGIRIAGQPVGLSIAAAPAVGDCLRPRGSDAAATHVAVGMGPVAPVTVPCALPHDAQVISVTSDPGQFPVVEQSGGQYPDLGACADAAYPFLGIRLPTDAGDRSNLLGPWRPASLGTFMFLSPDAMQRRVGQSWLACLLVSPQGIVTGSAAGVFTGRARGNPLALCRPGANVLLDMAISCNRPHAMELIGWRVADESVGGQRPLDQSCAELARRLTGMSDPTAGGALLVAAIVTHYDATGILRDGYAPAPHSELNRAACVITPTGSRLLAGTLTGLGDAPVPWAA